MVLTDYLTCTETLDWNRKDWRSRLEDFLSREVPNRSQEAPEAAAMAPEKPNPYSFERVVISYINAAREAGIAPEEAPKLFGILKRIRETGFSPEQFEHFYIFIKALIGKGLTAESLEVFADALKKHKISAAEGGQFLAVGHVDDEALRGIDIHLLS